MWGALLTRNENFLQNKLQNQLKNEIKGAEQRRDAKILKIQNKTIRKVQKLNIEYKYTQATKNMIHDWETSQASSMLAALRYVWVLGSN